jgi:hypothetical protein
MIVVVLLCSSTVARLFSNQVSRLFGGYSLVVMESHMSSHFEGCMPKVSNSRAVALSGLCRQGSSTLIMLAYLSVIIIVLCWE